MSNEPEKWSSLEEIAEHLGVSKDTIRNWIKKGVIPHRRIGKQYKFKISEEKIIIKIYFQFSKSNFCIETSFFSNLLTNNFN